MLFPKPLAVRAAIPRTVSINITIMTDRRAIPRSSRNMRTDRSPRSLTSAVPLQTNIARLHRSHQHPSPMVRIGQKRMVTGYGLWWGRRGTYALPKPLIVFRLPGHQRDLHHLDLVRRERCGGPGYIAQIIRLIETARKRALVVDDSIRNPSVDCRHTAVARIGQLEILDPFCNRAFGVRTCSDTRHASRQTWCSAAANIRGIGSKHDPIPD